MPIEIEHPVLLVLLAIALVPVYGIWAWALFGSSRGAIDAIRWAFARDGKSFLEGNYVEDKFAELRLLALLGLCGLSVAAAYRGVVVLLQLLFGTAA